MGQDDIANSILDLYEKTLMALSLLVEVGPSVSALVAAMSERDPSFSETYAKKYEAAKNEPLYRAIVPLIHSASQAVQRLKNHETN